MSATRDETANVVRLITGHPDLSPPLLDILLATGGNAERLRALANRIVSEAPSPSTGEASPVLVKRFAVFLDEAQHSINLIRIIRGATGASVNEAVRFMERVPTELKAGLTEAEASELLGQLNKIGANARILEYMDFDHAD